jgi:hypothetical protein
MSALSIQPTFPVFTDIDGQPLEAGYIFIGTANLNPITNPINVFFDAALTQPAVQPIRTISGYPSNAGTPARLYVNSDYSIQVQNKNGTLVYSAPTATERFSSDLITFVGFKGQVGTVADLADDDGSDWIGFEPAGSGAVARSAQDKLRETISVKDFGAVGDGVANDTAAIQSAVNHVAISGQILFFPVGTYRAVMIELKSNVTIEGEGRNSEIVMINDGIAVRQLFYAFGTTPALADYVQNVTLRNVALRGTVDVDAFSEFRHLLLLRGVTNLTVENCHFIGFQGDAMGFQAVDNFNNYDITIRNCVFDGINNDNRQAISLQAADKFLVTDCVFKNCTRSNMPGAIDIEPNPGYTWIILSSIIISNNTFENIGGDVGAVAMFIPIDSGALTQTPNNITVENNTFRNVYRGLYFWQLQNVNASATTPTINLNIINNSVVNATDRGFWLLGIAGAIVENNYFENIPEANRIGFTGTRGCYNILFSGNYFRACATTANENVINFYESERLGFIRNTFDGCGAVGICFGIFGSNGPCNDMQFIANQEYSGALDGLINRSVANTTITPATNVFVSNRGLVDNFSGYNFSPAQNNGASLGIAGLRWSEVFAINGVINTSDQNEKQQIENLSNIEKQIALSIKASIKKFKFNDAVEKKGEAARIHVGVIAQEVQQAFLDAGLDPNKYGLFCEDSWYEVNGAVVYPDSSGNYPQNAVKKTLLGVRYNELLAFVIAAL